jgi:hypothetical protein
MGPAFGERACADNKMKQDDDSKNHPALTCVDAATTAPSHEIPTGVTSLTPA